MQGKAALAAPLCVDDIMVIEFPQHFTEVREIEIEFEKFRHSCGTALLKGRHPAIPAIPAGFLFRSRLRRSLRQPGIAIRLLQTSVQGGTSVFLLQDPLDLVSHLFRHMAELCLLRRPVTENTDLPVFRGRILFQHPQDMHQALHLLPETGPDSLHRFPELPHLPVGDLRTVQVPASFHQIVRLVDQQDRSVPALKKAFQPRLGMKDIVVVADDDIREFRSIQGKIIGTHIVSAGAVRDRPGRHGRPLRRLLQQLLQGCIDPVKMTVRPRTDFRTAVSLPAGAGALPGDQGEAPDAETFAVKKGERLLRHRPRYPFGRQIKNTIRLARAERLEGRKQDRHSLAGTCGGLQEELFFMNDRPVDTCSQFILPLPVGKGKDHLPDRPPL